MVIGRYCTCVRMNKVDCWEMSVVEKRIAILRSEEQELAAHRFHLSPSRHAFAIPDERGYAEERENARTPFLAARTLEDWVRRKVEDGLAHPA